MGFFLNHHFIDLSFFPCFLFHRIIEVDWERQRRERREMSLDLHFELSRVTWVWMIRTLILILLYVISFVLVLLVLCTMWKPVWTAREGNKNPKKRKDDIFFLIIYAGLFLSLLGVLFPMLSGIRVWSLMQLDGMIPTRTPGTMGPTCAHQSVEKLRWQRS